MNAHTGNAMKRSHLSNSELYLPFRARCHSFVRYRPVSAAILPDVNAIDTAFRVVRYFAKITPGSRSRAAAIREFRGIASRLKSRERILSPI